MGFASKKSWITVANKATSAISGYMGKVIICDATIFVLDINIIFP